MIFLEANSGRFIIAILFSIFLLYVAIYAMVKGYISPPQNKRMHAPPKSVKSEFVPTIQHELLRTFGKDKSFIAFIADGFICLNCGGGTGFAKKLYSRENYFGILRQIYDIDEDGVIQYCKEGGWLYYDYYRQELLQRSKSGSPILYHKFKNWETQ